MSARILSGRAIADSILTELRGELANLADIHNFRPRLDVVRVGDDAASEVYVGNKVRTAAELGIDSREHHLDKETAQAELLSLIEALGRDEQVDGILVQLPLPGHIDEREVLEAVDPRRDVDGFHPVNVGNLTLGYPSLVPCTPAGVIEILKRSGIEIAGKHAVVVGRSNIVGKPMAALLLRENATVTVCHSRTHDLASITSRADILVAAIGKPAAIGAEHIREGAVVIDVGINRLTDASQLETLFSAEDVEKRRRAIQARGSTLIGDVVPKAALERASHFTPVPGGVGLLTVAMLMKNTLTAAKMRRGIEV
ncbi:MAG: bifunctional 5,10-methylenetetrahydrofolate dehydrogenase/5,10-methenyltetrahydrofolate cyclohydrolase [Chloracidobacterium sp.]|nr:bifunctional 5,10-methylenetetrahydrofolate dehydrogenase/5,10-methenyltetrahydrofolate cyclohydrolase [Chloracidobacterium sp.]MCC6825099.1 bifunctional 5,10-methylenetetrahydrofolate dehydrogenase/5,10-methenyltetrahydrofolate cyclohydrolase [Acidobacteriota bacterium]MCO5334286.1 bifunctional 5,10-methylenetetrahydrofolate dehydrogenase/5,10-methenyltetrahydrofolate cyclohydrolase [Pyrinomonadaceae bacterium]